ncbi:MULTISPECIES: alpha/beta hydrolase [Pseudonocardia]|uniref:Alpha/beta hydrolase family protein n=1 Tax=Pseudonocardia alni TaxID=33907 RepID=A0AA44ZR73_PSEA5|nr:alpha/beta hydrolase [Pseudonocardia alni]OJG06018.1 Tripeptidyl aminopeptidase precursor [Pseudonocardia autotrophica]PKB32738.1 alpha/beta hydrolase family protein [Pseudonocardia alni]
MRRTIITLLVAVGVTLGTAGPALAAPAPPPPGQGITWGPCTSPSLQQAKAECGFLKVPLDHAQPAGKKIEIAVSRIRHTVPQAQYQGVVLVNPGGPGGPGLGLSRLGGAVPKNAGAAYDWIGFDPRGVGMSRPALTCDADYGGYARPDYRPENGAEKAWLPKAEAYARACGKAGGDLLAHLRTEDTVRDMDLIRRALGAPQINYYGFSYGTMLGQVYATMFPDKVRRMVLDGVVDPRDWWYRANLKQDVAFQRNIETFFDWVAKNDATYHLGTTGDAVEKRFYDLAAEFRKAPLGGRIGSSEWTDIFLRAGYNVGEYTSVADAFVAGTKKDAAALKAAYDQAGSPTDDNNYAVYLATQCTDAPFPHDWATWKRDNTATDRKAPFETWGNAWYNAPCRDWPVKPGPAPKVAGTLRTGPLLISETYDGATPYEGALQARRTFPGSSLVEGVGGHTHSSSLSGIACTDDTVADYLLTGALPKRTGGDRSDRQCPPLPPPSPAAAGG